VKIFINLLVVLLLALGWAYHVRGKSSAERQLEELDRREAQGEIIDDETRARLVSDASGQRNESIGVGILLSFLSAGYVGLVFVVYVLPAMAHKATHAIYDSGEMVETDPMHDARALVAQGDWPAAIEAFREAAVNLPGQRLPWVEIAKIQRDNLEDPDAAIATFIHALENYEWQQNDAAYFLFRLAELYDQDKGDRESAAAIMQQVIQQFPETRHSANARHRLHDWGIQLA
jgi:tetratricopeptide (TPR) repeat protein